MIPGRLDEGPACLQPDLDVGDEVVSQVVQVQGLDLVEVIRGTGDDLEVRADLVGLRTRLVLGARPHVQHQGRGSQISAQAVQLLVVGLLHRPDARVQHRPAALTLGQKSAAGLIVDPPAQVLGLLGVIHPL